MTILLSVLRVPVETLHPVFAGPRYFFLPYVLLSWLLLYLIDIDDRHRGTTVLCLAALLLSVRMAFLYGPRSHDRLDWRAEVGKCLDSADSSHTFPIHYDGNASPGNLWSVTLDRDTCRRLVESSLFDNRVGAVGSKAPVPRPQ